MQGAKTRNSRKVNNNVIFKMNSMCQVWSEEYSFLKKSREDFEDLMHDGYPHLLVYNNERRTGQ